LNVPEFEQRWAAKLASAAPKSIDLKGTVNSLPRPATAKEKPAGAKAAASRRRAFS
jgi:hypothetical protein